MPQKNFGIGIVGCGTISGVHAEAILSTNRANLVAACSRSRSKLDPFCEEYGIPGFSSYEEFLANPDLDIVSICTPNGTHLDYGKPAAEAGKHVIVEKPIETTVQRGRRLIESCKRNGVELAVIYQNRFIDDVAKMKEFLDAQKLGRIVMADASVKWFRDQAYYSNFEGRGTYALDGGGAVINQAIHTVDLLQWFVGEVEFISAFKGTITHKEIEVEDNAVASMQFKNGAIGIFEASTSIAPPQERRIEIHGSKGTALLEGDRFSRKLNGDAHRETEDGKAESAGAASPLAGMTADNHKKQYDRILEAIRENKETVVSGEESLKSLAIVEAIYASADKEERVLVDDVLEKAGN